MLVNLDTVFEVAEAEGGSAFMFTNGSVLVVRDDFDTVALAIGHEGCLECAPPREQLPLVPYQISETEPPRHPWRTFNAMHEVAR